LQKLVEILNTKKLETIDIYRQSLAILLSIISADDKVEYSVKNATQFIVNNKVIEIVKKNKEKYKSFKDVQLISNNVLNIVVNE
jgi:uncharacterized membrane protein YkgB